MSSVLKLIVLLPLVLPHVVDGNVPGAHRDVGKPYVRLVTAQVLLLVVSGAGDVFMTSAASLTLHFSFAGDTSKNM